MQEKHEAAGFTCVCGNEEFVPLYDCKTEGCKVTDYVGEPGPIPESLPTKKACPGCQSTNYTSRFQCMACGAIQQF